MPELVWNLTKSSYEIKGIQRYSSDQLYGSPIMALYKMKLSFCHVHKPLCRISVVHLSHDQIILFPCAKRLHALHNI